MMRRWMLLTLLLSTLPAPLLTTGAWGESIFSREALGEWREPYDLRAQGMGGVSIAIRDSFPHAQQNPAGIIFSRLSIAYVSIYPEKRWLRVPADGSACPNGLECPSSGGTKSQVSGGLANIHSVIKLGPRWSLGLGVRQINDPAYQIVNMIDSGGIGEAERQEEGTGGFLSYTLGLAYRVSPDFSIGFEGSRISGAITDIVEYNFTNGNYMDTRDELTTRMKKGWQGRLGFLWAPGRLAMGGFYATAVAADGTWNWRNQDGVQTRLSFDIDLPPSAGYGMALDLGDRWRAGYDIVWRGWSKAKFPALDGSEPDYTDTWRIGLGVEKIGEVSTRARFGEGVSLRAGLSYTPWYFENAEGRRVTESAVSMGLGLPLSKDRGRIDFLLELGKRSVEEMKRPDEIFLRLGLGATYGSMPREY